MTLEWPWPILQQGQIWKCRLFYRKTVDFSETIAASDLKGNRSRHLIELMKVCKYWRSRSFLYHMFSRFCMFCALLGQDIRWAFTGPLVLWFAYAKTKTQISFTGTAKLISTFVFATRLVHFLYYLNPKFEGSSHLLGLHSLVYVGPLSRKPRRPVYSQQGSYDKITYFFYFSRQILLTLSTSNIIRTKTVDKNCLKVTILTMTHLKINYSREWHKKCVQILSRENIQTVQSDLRL